MYYPQYNPYMPNQQNYQMQIKQLEDKLAGLTQGFQNPPQQAQTYQPMQTPTPQFITVKSAEEAWNNAPMWDGSKQYFINPELGEIYIQWIDLKKPETIREVYKKTTEEAEPTPEKADELITEIKALKAEVTEMKGGFENVTKSIERCTDAVKASVELSCT